MELYPRENKSVTIPIQIIQHLGFVLDFIDMTVFMTVAKITKLTETARIIFSKTVVEILLVAKLIGHMVFCFPAQEFGELLNRQVEIDKSTALKEAKGNFDAYMALSDRAKSDIQRWISDALLPKNAINHGSINFIVNTDAVLQGWGATTEHTTAGERWSNVEKEHHISI